MKTLEEGILFAVLDEDYETAREKIDSMFPGEIRAFLQALYKAEGIAERVLKEGTHLHTERG